MPERRHQSHKPATRSTARTIDEYIAEFPPQAQAALREMRALIHALAPAAGGFDPADRQVQAGRERAQSVAGPAFRRADDRHAPDAHRSGHARPGHVALHDGRDARVAVGLLVAGPLAEMIDVAGWFALSGAPITDGLVA